MSQMDVFTHLFRSGEVPLTGGQALFRGTSAAAVGQNAPCSAPSRLNTRISRPWVELTIHSNLNSMEFSSHSTASEIRIDCKATPNRAERRN